MGSGNRFDYTLEERAALMGSFASAMKIANEQLRSAKQVSDALQAIIGDDDLILVPKVTKTPSDKIYHVTSDVNIRTAVGAINALNCPVKWGLAETPAKIPMVIQPVDCRVRAIPLGKITTTEEVYKLYPKIVTPAEFFAFGAKFPEEQREAPIFAIWLDACGRFFYAILHVSRGERYVNVSDDHPVDKWHGLYRLLVRE
jgi:hypothetical protein